MASTTAWDAKMSRYDTAAWTDEEYEWFCMGPFDGEVPGLVRRIRRILDVSQRGLAELLEVSQSVVARWETGRTSPRASVVHHLLRLAGLHASFHDDDTGEQVEPMRDDGARDRGGRRHPAHVDLRVIGWWAPRGAESTAHWLRWRQQSRARRDPSIRFRTSRHLRRLERLLYGTPDDHPSLDQLAAEAEHLDEVREGRRRRAGAGSRWPTSPGDPSRRDEMRRHASREERPTSLTP